MISIKSKSFKYCVGLVIILILLAQAYYLKKVYIDPKASASKSVKSSGKSFINVSNYVASKPDIIKYLVVSTESGRLRGFIQNVSGIPVQTFLSVPYAQPPINELRFRRTQPLNKWKGIRDATKFPPPCVQPEYTQRYFSLNILNANISEDCLFLNIWNPIDGTANKTVMVFIHGGLFTIGGTSIDEYDGRMLAAYGNVIVITIQYRIGIFGFLDMDSERIPGNMGLFDQHTALKWINENIKYFGGNPDSITVFGTSAGSISIGFHMFSPITKSLFRRAIIQSGSPMLLRHAFDRAEKVAVQFTKLIGCYKEDANNSSIFDDPEPIIDCIDETSYEDIFQALSKMVDKNPMPFMPTIPSEYIEQTVNDYNESTKISQTEIMMGFNYNEGALILHLSYPKNYTRHTVPDLTTLKQVQERVIEMVIDAGFNEGFANTIATLFLRGNETDESIQWAKKVAQLFGDTMFVCPTYQFLDKLLSFNHEEYEYETDEDYDSVNNERNSTTIKSISNVHNDKLKLYLYMFAQRSKNTPWGDWMEVTHHDELIFVMGHPLRYPKLYSDEDIEISKIIMKTWSHFAKTGEIPQELYPKPWTPYSDEAKYFMRIESKNMTLDSNYHGDVCETYNFMTEVMG